MAIPLWRQIQRGNFTSPSALADFLGLELEEWAPQHFPLNLPRRLAEKIEKGNICDPILRQFLPSRDEGVAEEGFFSDPVGDRESQKSSSLLHKYHGRALLITTSACAMNCRYCFRQNYSYVKTTYEAELELIRNDPSIKEIILSGGDPLSLSDKVLGDLLCELDAIPHLSLVRFHTRFPIGIPERITEELLSMLDALRLQVVFIIHANHPRELDDDVIAACKQVQRQGIPVLCQSVLLAGVNDDADTLEALCLRLISGGIIPYYLHQLDRIKGGSRFEVDEERGKALIAKLQSRLPGYAVPKYVREVAGEASKRNLITSDP